VWIINTVKTLVYKTRVIMQRVVIYWSTMDVIVEYSITLKI